MDLLLTILGIFVAFFIPGYIISSLLLKNFRFKIPISIGLSICVLTFLGFILGLFGLLKSGYLWFFLLILILIPLIYYKKLFLNKIKNINFRKIFNKKNLFILFLLILGFLAVYFVRFGPSQAYSNFSPNSFSDSFIPIHSDEWTHLSQVKYTINSGENVFINPYLKSLPRENNFEVGFHTFTAAFFSLVGLDLVKNYSLLAALFSVITSLLIYSFVFLWTKQRIIGIFSMLFFLSLPSNSSLLGSWFYVPMSMSLFIVFLFLVLLFQAKKEKDFYVLGFILVVSLLIYPFVTILLGIFSLFYWFKERDILKLRFNLKHRGVLALFVGLILILIILLTDFRTILSLFVFEKGWRSMEDIYSPLSLMGIGWLLLSFIGIFVSFTKKYNPIILYTLVILSLNILIFYIFDKSFLFMYRINFYYFLLFFSLFGAIGSSYLIKNGEKLIRKENLKIIFRIFSIIILLGILFLGYYHVEEAKIYRVIDSEEFFTLKKLGQGYSGEVILADTLISQYIYPITDNYVVGLLASTIWTGDTERIHEFFSESTSCRRKVEIYHETESDLIISKKPIINCPEIEKYLNSEFEPYYYLY